MLDLALIGHLAEPVPVKPKQVPAILDREVLHSPPLQVGHVFGLQVRNVHAKLGAALLPSGLKYGGGERDKKSSLQRVSATPPSPRLACPIRTSVVTGIGETLVFPPPE